MSKKLALLLVFAMSVLLPALLAADDHPAVGTVAPLFTLVSQDGNPVSLQALRGKWVVLYFYPKDFTPGCTIEAHNFQRDMAEYTKLNAIVVGVSTDDPASHNGFCKQEALHFDLLSDTEHVAVKLYGALSTEGFAHAERHTFLIAPDGKIAAVWEDVKPNEHSAEVLAKLSALQSK